MDRLTAADIESRFEHAGRTEAMSWCVGAMSLVVIALLLMLPGPSTAPFWGRLLFTVFFGGMLLNVVRLGYRRARQDRREGREGLAALLAANEQKS